MIKRLISLLLVGLVISCTIITVHANPAVDWFMFCYDLGKRWYTNTYSDVEQMSGDEFYDFYNQKNPDARSVFYRAYDFAVSSLYSRDQYGRLGTPKTITDMNGAMYDRLLLNDYLLDKLDEAAITGYTSDYRYSSLGDLNLVTDYPISVNNISVSGTVVHNLGSGNNAVLCKSFYNFNGALSDSTHISIYRGGLLPPLIYVPSNGVLYQNGIKLPGKSFYIVLGSNLLLRIPHGTGFGSFIDPANPLLTYAYFNSGNSLEDLKFLVTKPYTDNNTSHTLYNQFVCGGSGGNLYSMDVYVDGAVLCITNRDPYTGWVLLDLVEKMLGFCIEVDGSDPLVGSNLPEDVPYDDDGAVVVMIPQDGGDVIYMNPAEYNSYVDNGTYVEGDYMPDYSSSTINNITDSYNTYITNNTNVSTYDDSTLLGKIDDLIDWVKKIHTKLDFLSKHKELDGVFSADPIYEDFSDCIVDHISLVSDVSDLVESMSTEEASSGVSDIYEISDEPPDPTDKVKTLYYGFNLNTSWYDQYRLKIRDLLKIPCWILGILGIWVSFRSVFGIHSNGGG